MLKLQKNSQDWLDYYQNYPVSVSILSFVKTKIIEHGSDFKSDLVLEPLKMEEIISEVEANKIQGRIVEYTVGFSQRASRVIDKALDRRGIPPDLTDGVYMRSAVSRKYSSEESEKTLLKFLAEILKR